MLSPTQGDLRNCCELLKKAIEAHGGIGTWRSVQEFVVRVHTGGIALPLRLQSSAFKSVEVIVSTTEARTVIHPHPVEGQKGIFEGDIVRIADRNNRVLQERQDPRAYFGSLKRNILWDELDVLYFGGYALWNYLNLPFLLAGPGFSVTEIAPWKENGKTLRRLHAVFPPGIPTHCREQVFYFDPEYLLVRHDYTAEVFGQWAKAAHYSGNHRDYEGIIIPTRRKVFPRLSSNRPLRLITLVSVNIEVARVVKKH